MAEFPLGEVAANAAERLAPEIADHVAGLNATAPFVTADLSLHSDCREKWRHDIRARSDATPRSAIPTAMSGRRRSPASVRVVDGRAKLDERDRDDQWREGQAVAGDQDWSPSRTRGAYCVPSERRIGRLDDAALRKLPEALDHLQRAEISVGEVDARRRSLQAFAGRDWSRRGGSSRPSGRSISVTGSPAREPAGNARSRCGRNRSR